MLTFTICDDETTEISYLTTLLHQWANETNTPFRLFTFQSAEQFLFAYEEDKSTDILLLDIQMGEMDGVELARKLRTKNDKVQIIFITGFPDFMAYGYDVAALHYLMKPVSAEKLFAVLNRAAAQISRQPPAILLTIDGEQVRLSLDEIIYIEALDHNLEILTRNTGKLTVKMPLYQLENKLTPEFVHCHRSYIVNLRHVSKITKTEVVIDSGTSLPLARRQYTAVNKAMMQYLKGGASE